MPLQANVTTMMKLLCIKELKSNKRQIITNRIRMRKRRPVVLKTSEDYSKMTKIVSAPMRRSNNDNMSWKAGFFGFL